MRLLFSYCATFDGLRTVYQVLLLGFLERFHVALCELGLSEERNEHLVVS